MKCPHCEKEIESRSLPNDVHIVAYRIMIERMGWMFPENTDAWTFSEILINTAGGITKAFLDIFDNDYESNQVKSQQEYDEEEHRQKIKELDRKSVV